MAGHNKWSNVTRIRGAIDAKQEKPFSRLAKEIAMAAKLGGPDLEVGVRVCTSPSHQNMPTDNIARAIKRGRGDSREPQVVSSGFRPRASDLRHLSSQH